MIPVPKNTADGVRRQRAAHAHARVVVRPDRFSASHKSHTGWAIVRHNTAVCSACSNLAYGDNVRLWDQGTRGVLKRGPAGRRRLWNRKHDFYGAESVLQKALAVDQDHVGVLLQLGTVYCRTIAHACARERSCMAEPAACLPAGLARAATETRASSTNQRR